MDRTQVGLDVLVGRGKHIRIREVRHDLSTVEEHDSVGEIQSLVQIMSYQQGRFVEACEQIADSGLKFGTGDWIQRAKWLVE